MPPLVLSDAGIEQLQALASSRSLPHSIVQRAQIVLACGAGETNTAIATRMGLTGMTQGLLEVIPTVVLSQVPSTPAASAAL